MGRFTRHRQADDNEIRPADPTMDAYKVGGSFQCQFPLCEGVVFDATYLPQTRELGWKCPDGHISSIKDFIL